MGIAFLFNTVLEPLFNMMLGNGGFEKAKMAVFSGVSDFYTAKDKVVTKMFQNLRKFPPGEGRDEIASALRALLAGKLKLSLLAPAGFKVIEQITVREINKLVSWLLTPVYNEVMNCMGLWALDAATFGINIGVASGSVTTEWISTGILNIIQATWTQMQVIGRDALLATQKLLIGQTVGL